MAKIKSVFVCQNCGYETPKWIGKCPSCESWNSMTEEQKNTAQDFQRAVTISSGNKPKSILNIKSSEYERFDTGISELNRVLGGGLVRG